MGKRLQRKSILAVLLALFLAFSIAGIAGMFGGIKVSADEDDPTKWDGDLIAAGWDGSKTDATVDGYAVKWVEKSEIDENGLKDGVTGATDYSEGKVAYIEISTAKALVYFSYKVNKDTDHKLDGAYVKLTENINLDSKIWIPIGQVGRPADTKTRPQIRFSGTFDGDGHKISNLHADGLLDSLVKEGSSYFIKYSETLKIPFTPKGVEYCYGLFAITENIKVKDLSVVDVNFLFDKEGVKSELIADRCGTIIGYSEGEVILENCVAGSPDTDDEIYTYSTESTLGGLVGGIYAFGATDSISDYQDITFTGCVSYVNITEDKSVSSPGKFGGMLGYVGTRKDCLTFENCINYGNITGGSYLGGMTSYYYPASGLKSTDKIVNCVNYGNIVSKVAKEAGGMGNVSACYYEAKIIVSGCINYGTVGAEVAAGGILGILDQEHRDTPTDLTNNYNYGDIYCYGDGSGKAGNNQTATSAGGLVGFVYYNGTLTYSGGNAGTVHGGQNVASSLESINSSIGKIVRNTANTAKPVLVKNFIADVGFVITYENNTKVPDAPDADLSNIVVPDRYTQTYEDGTFKYGSADKSILLGFADATNFAGTPESPAELVIPKNVKTIAYAAFAGNKGISKLTFETSNQLTSIEDWAFAGCTKLNNVELPSNADKISLGVGVFGDTRENAAGNAQGAYLIASGSTQYWKLNTNAGYTQSGGILTYAVTVNYVGLNNEQLYTEKKLYNLDYKVELSAGQWTTNTSMESFQPNGMVKNWRNSVNGNITYSIEDMTTLLLTVNGNTITLYEYSAGSDKLFLPGVGITYDANKTYTVNDLNPLLHDTSAKIDGTMTVSIEKYTTIEGVEKDIPAVVHNAGIYTIKIEDGGDTYHVNITINRATLDLSNTANLQWHVTDIKGESANIELSTETLYLYEYRSKEGVYPSTEPLTAEQITKLGLKNGYTREIVQYSVVRNRNGQITIALTNDAYTVTDYTGATETDVGKYLATATLSSDNYVFTGEGKINLRGMEIKLSADGTATVTKEWYIVDISNWLTNGSGEDYVITGLVFGNVSVSAPVPYYYNGDPQLMTMVLSMYSSEASDYAMVGEGNMSVFSQYVNSVMPAGDYRLDVTVGGVTAVEQDGTETYHNGFSETIYFTVAKAKLTSLDAIHALLKDKEGGFSIEIQGANDNRLFDDKTATDLEALLSPGYIAPDLSGTAWTSSYYDSKLVIEYNLLRAQSDLYTAEVPTSTPDTYKVYYKISAKNFYSSIEELAEGDNRFKYFFTLVKIGLVETPTFSVETLEYTGNKVLPTIAENKLYEISWNDAEYVTGGNHTVSFTLYDPDHYHWIEKEGLSDEGATLTVTYVVKAANNSFTLSLNMLGWSYKDYGAANSIRAILKFGTVDIIKFKVTPLDSTMAVNSKLADFGINADGTVTDPDVVESLTKLDAGSYMLRATITGNSNYNGFTDQVEFKVAKAANSWAVGDEDLILPSWIVGKYNKNENPIVVKAKHGDVNFKITDIDGKVYYDSTDKNANLEDSLNKMAVGKYLLTAWVDETGNFFKLEERSFTIQVLEKIGLPWWATLLITVGALGLAALILFILWKKGVFQILTEKLAVAIRTRVSVEATIASVRAAKMMEEGRQSVAEAKRKERLEMLRKKAQEEREMSPEERAAKLEAKAQADAEKAEKLRKRSEAAQKRAEKLLNQESNTADGANDTPETPTEE